MFSEIEKSLLSQSVALNMVILADSIRDNRKLLDQFPDLDSAPLLLRQIEADKGSWDLLDLLGRKLAGMA